MYFVFVNLPIQLLYFMCFLGFLTWLQKLLLVRDEVFEKNGNFIIYYILQKLLSARDEVFGKNGNDVTYYIDRIIEISILLFIMFLMSLVIYEYWWTYNNKDKIKNARDAIHDECIANP